MKTILFRLKGTVILKIWWQVVLVSLYTVGALCVVKYALGWKLDWASTVEKRLNFQKESTIGIFGLFTGFLLVFRTNTAYDRYWEGRKLWGSIIFNIRTLTRLIWTMVPTNLPLKEGSKITGNQIFVEKVSTINLLVAFAYATRNYLRDDHSYEEKDLAELLKHIPKLYFQMDNDDIKLSSSTSRIPPRNIPIEISHLVMSYIKTIRQRNYLDDPTTTTINNSLVSLVECIGSLEKIVGTPIPMAYSVHLHHATWLYFLALPYQLMGVLDWFTIPVVALAAFAMLGILNIGWEIENPFGYDDNDLPLDDFCKVIHEEVLEVIGNPTPSAETWILSGDNQPLKPESCLSANELALLSEIDIRQILARYRHYPLDKS